MIAALWVTIAVAAPGSWAARGTLDTPVEAPFQQFTLPIGAYLAAKYPDLRDLRVLDGSGAEVPYARVASPAPEPPRSVPFVGFAGEPAAADLQFDTKGGLSGLKTAGQAGPKRGYLFSGDAVGDVVAVKVDLAEAEAGYQHVAVEASDDGTAWTTVVPDATLLRLTVDGQPLRRGTIELPPGPHRLLRVVWPEGKAAVAVGSIEVTVRFGGSGQPPMAWSGPVAGTRTAEGDVLVLPNTVRAEALRVGLKGANTLAPVTLSAWTNPGDPWRDLADGTVYQLRAQDRDWTNEPFSLAIPVHAVRLKANQGSLGDPPPTLELGVHPDRVIFVASGKGPYTLAVGQLDAPAVALAPNTLVPGYGYGDAPPIGAATATLDFPLTPSATPAPGTAAAIPKAWKLWGVLLVGVAMLGGMAASLAKRPKA